MVQEQFGADVPDRTTLTLPLTRASLGTGEQASDQAEKLLKFRGKPRTKGKVTRTMEVEKVTKGRKSAKTKASRRSVPMRAGISTRFFRIKGAVGTLTMVIQDAPRDAIGCGRLRVR